MAYHVLLPKLVPLSTAEMEERLQRLPKPVCCVAVWTELGLAVRCWSDQSTILDAKTYQPLDLVGDEFRRFRENDSTVESFRIGDTQAPVLLSVDEFELFHRQYALPFMEFDWVYVDGREIVVTARFSG